MPSNEAPQGAPRRFATTRWSVVLAAGQGGTPQSERALAELCGDYWYPLYAYVRRQGRDADEARDLTQAFFARLLETHGLRTADPTRGRFRSFLLTSMKRFLTSEWRRQVAEKRGGGVPTLSLDYDDAEQRYRVEPGDDLTPEAVYERRWALGLLDRAVTELQAQYEARGQGPLFEALKGFLGHDPTGLPYSELAPRLGQSEGALRTAASRLRSRWRDRLLELVAETVRDGDSVEDELRSLLAAL